MISISRRYHFEAAHLLPKVLDGHRCKRLHGHNYEMEVTLVGGINDVGFIMDFWDLDRLVQPILDRVDHRYLNDVPGLENPTAEFIALWFLARLRQAIEDESTGVSSVRIYETKDCWAVAT